MEHFKEYLAYTPFVVSTDNNPLTYILTTPNLDATGHRWADTLPLFEFTLEYQKGQTMEQPMPSAEPPSVMTIQQSDRCWRVPS